MILQQLQGKQVSQAMQALLPSIRQAKQVMRMVKSANNPQLMLQQMIQNNPNYAEAMQLINSYNGDLNTAISTLCSQHGIDMNEFINELNSGL